MSGDAPAKQRVTHHERLLNTMRGHITGGDWPPGYLLPPELQLAGDHGVSRMTMNKVLAQLTREGYLVRKRKSGTFVAQPVAQSAVLDISDIEAEVRALGLPWRFELRERTVRAPLPDEARLARIDADDAPVLVLRGVHYAGDDPFCREARIINLAAAPGAADVDFADMAPGAWLLREIPWTSAEHRIRAVSAPAPVARDLGVSTGTACLEVLRRTEIAGQWVTAVTQSYPGDRHELVAEFGPQTTMR